MIFSAFLRVIKTMKKPIEIVPGIYLGDATQSQNQEIMKDFQGVINVTDDVPNKFEDKIYYRISIKDVGFTDTIPTLQCAFRFIEDHKPVFIHCFAAISRSPSVIIAYIMWKDKIPFQEAYKMVQDKKSDIDPVFAFCAQLTVHEKEIHAINI
jgi:hypothetical protein